MLAKVVVLGAIGSRILSFAVHANNGALIPYKTNPGPRSHCSAHDILFLMLCCAQLLLNQSKIGAFDRDNYYAFGECCSASAAGPQLLLLLRCGGH